MNTDAQRPDDHRTGDPVDVDKRPASDLLAALEGAVDAARAERRRGARS